MTDRASGCGRVSKPCLVLRLRRRSHLQWAEISHAEHHRRVYAGMLGDPREPETQLHGCHRCLSDLFIMRGVPGHVRSDNGPISSPKPSRTGSRGRRQDHLYRAWQPLGKRYCESFNSKLRDELLDGEIFYTLEEARVIIENWRRCYNEIRPHSSLGYRPPAPRVLMPARPAAQPEPASPAAPSLAQRSTLN